MDLWQKEPWATGSPVLRTEASLYQPILPATSTPGPTEEERETLSSYASIDLPVSLYLRVPLYLSVHLFRSIYLSVSLHL